MGYERCDLNINGRDYAGNFFRTNHACTGSEVSTLVSYHAKANRLLRIHHLLRIPYVLQLALFRYGDHHVTVNSNLAGQPFTG